MPWPRPWALSRTAVITFSIILKPAGRSRDVKTNFHAACRRAKKDPNDKKDPGITAVRFHDLRHTFASRALELGADIMTVSRILGHGSIMMTAKYLHLSSESMRTAVGKVAEFLDQSGQKADTPSVTVPPVSRTTVSSRYN